MTEKTLSKWSERGFHVDASWKRTVGSLWEGSIKALMKFCAIGTQLGSYGDGEAEI